MDSMPSKTLTKPYKYPLQDKKKKGLKEKRERRKKYWQEN